MRFDSARQVSQAVQVRLANRNGYGSGPYDDLNQVSKLVRRFRRDMRSSRRITLLVPSFAPSSQFAGVKTALRLAGKLARLHNAPLRIVSVEFVPERLMRTYVDQLAKIVDLPQVELQSLGAARAVPYSADDIWIATYWTTAHLMDIAGRLGMIDPSRVLYLVQDYEPCFMPWSTDATLAKATYHAGFHMVANSKPLRDYLHDVEQITVGDEYTFAPDLDYAALEKAASRRQPSSTVRIFFYGRPSKPRNLYKLGTTTLRVFANSWSQNPAARSVKLEVVTAGEPTKPLGLHSSLSEVSLGQTTWDSYYDLLSTTSVALSLMLSPHPSHPPLESAIAGALSVSNQFGRYREGLHPRLSTAPADPDLLADSLMRAVETAISDGPGEFQPLAAGALGSDFDQVAERCAQKF